MISKTKIHIINFFSRNNQFNIFIHHIQCSFVSLKTQQFSNPKKTQQFSTLFANVISKPLLSESSAVDLHPHLLADGSCDGAVDL